MMQAVTKIVAINAQMPATIGFGVHRYWILEAKMPMNTMAWMSFTGTSESYVNQFITPEGSGVGQ